jgi:protein-disulfide isomerase
MSARVGIGPTAGWVGVAVLVAAVAMGALAWFNLDSGLRSSAPATAGQVPEDEFERRVRDYLLENPEVLLEALEVLEARRMQAEDGEVAEVIAARSDELLNDPASPVGGNPDGAVTLVYLFDYNCPYCRQAAPMLEEAVEANDDVRIVFKEFPVLGPGSEAAARIALAAERQGTYGELHDALMGQSGRIGESEVLEVARELGLDVAQLEEDATDPAIEEAIAANLALARDLRINGTPSFVVGQEVLRGLIDIGTLRQAIDRAEPEERG